MIGMSRKLCLLNYQYHIISANNLFYKTPREISTNLGICSNYVIPVPLAVHQLIRVAWAGMAKTFHLAPDPVSSWMFMPKNEVASDNGMKMKARKDILPTASDCRSNYLDPAMTGCRS